MKLKIVKADKRVGDERKDKICLICDQPSEETSILLKNLMKRFMSKKENAEEEYQNLKKDEGASYHKIFSDVVELVTGFQPREASKSCMHLQIEK